MEVREYNDCVHELSDALFRFSLKSTANREDANDVVQGAFEVLWQKRDMVVKEKAKAFLFQVAYRQCIDTFRRKVKYAPGELPERTETPRNTDLKKTLDAALNILDDQSRALVLLKDYEGYSYEEIGRITDLSDAQVKVYLHRARKTLKEYLVSIEFVL